MAGLGDVQRDEVVDLLQEAIDSHVRRYHPDGPLSASLPADNGMTPTEVAAEEAGEAEATTEPASPPLVEPAAPAPGSVPAEWQQPGFYLTLLPVLLALVPALKQFIGEDQISSLSVVLAGLATAGAAAFVYVQRLRQKTALTARVDDRQNERLAQLQLTSIRLGQRAE